MAGHKKAGGSEPPLDLPLNISLNAYATCEWPEFYINKDMFCSGNFLKLFSLVFFLFGLMLYMPVNSYGHVGQAIVFWLFLKINFFKKLFKDHYQSVSFFGFEEVLMLVK